MTKEKLDDEVKGDESNVPTEYRFHFLYVLFMLM